MTEIVDETQSNRDDQPAANDVVEHSAPNSNDQSDIPIHPTAKQRDDQDDSDGDPVYHSTSDSDNQSDDDLSAKDSPLYFCNMISSVPQQAATQPIVHCSLFNVMNKHSTKTI